MFKNDLKKIHSGIKTGVLFATESFLHIIKIILGFSFFWLPVIYIWIGIIDKNLNPLWVVAVIAIGVICFYITIALEHILKYGTGEYQKQSEKTGIDKVLEELKEDYGESFIGEVYKRAFDEGGGGVKGFEAGQNKLFELYFNKKLSK